MLNAHWHSAAPVVSEELIAKVMELLPSHPTVEGLMGTGDLKGLPTAKVHAAIHILEERRKVKAGELFGRDMPPQDEP